MRKTQKHLAVLLAVVMVLCLVPAMVFGAGDDGQVVRISGDDRYATSAETALKAFPNGADTVIIARGDDEGNFADGLAASYLAGVKDAPILLTKPNELPADVKGAIITLRAKDAIILGSDAVVTQKVANELAGLNVERIWGANRYETAAKIAAEGGSADTAFVVSGYAPADSLVAGPLAFSEGCPVLLADDNNVNFALDAIDELGIKNIIVVGGTGVVSENVYNQLAAKVGNDNIKRCAGENRVETSLEVVKLYTNPKDFSIVGYNGLADAVGAAVFGNPIIYVDGDEVPNIAESVTPETNFFIFGGTGRVSDVVETALGELLVPEEELTVVGVDSIDPIEVEFGTLVDDLGLPETVGVTLSNDETDVANIEWNTENYDPELEGTQVLEGTLVVPEGKEWTIPAEFQTVTIEVIVGEDSRVEVKEAVALSATKVQLVEIPAEVKAEDLKDAKIILTAGDVELTATYALGSYANGKAVFNLDGNKKLEDAVTYTVSADWAKFTTNTFVAKITKPYAKTFEAVTKAIASNVKADGAKGDSAKIVFTAKDQYGEAIALTTAMNVKATLNGMPLTATEATITSPNFDTVVINTLLKENDILVVTIENVDANNKVIGTSTFEYVIGKAQAAVPTTIVGVKATTAGKDVEEVLANDTYTLVADVRDQFNNPVDAKLRWVVVEGAELLDTSANNSGGLGSDKITFDTETTAKNATAVKILKPGTLTIDVYNIANSTKYTYTVEVGATALSSLTSTTENTTGKNNEEVIVGVVTANPGAALTPEMIKFEVKANTKDTTADDIEVSAALRKDVDKNVEEDAANANDIVVVAKTSKVGDYAITPYVVINDKTIKATALTLTTSLNTVATSIDPMVVPTLKVGTPVDVQIVVRNKHGEDITAYVKDNVKNVIYKDGVTSTTGLTVGVPTIDTSNKVYNVKFTAEEAGKYTVRFTVDGTAVMYEVPVTAEATKLASIDLGLDIYDGVIAGDTDPVYRVITALDNKGDKIIPAIDGWKVLVDGVVSTDQKVAYVAKNKTTGKWEVKEDKAEAEEIALVIDPSKFGYDEDKVVTVTVNNGKTDKDKVESELSVKVKAARVVKTIELVPETTKLAIGGETTLNILTKDQYGDFIEVKGDNNTINLTVTSGNEECVELVKDNSAVKIEEVKDNKGNVIGYKVTVKAVAKGSSEVAVKTGEIEAKVTFTVDAAGNLVDSVVIDTKDIKDLYFTGVESGESVEIEKLEAIAKDADGNSIPGTEFVWSVVEVLDAKGNPTTGVTVDADGKVTATKGFVGSATIKVMAAKVGGGTATDTITLNFDNAPSKAVMSTLKLVQTVEGKDVEVTELEISEATTVNLVAKDQYGEDFDFAGAEVQILVADKTIVTATATDGTITITPETEDEANIEGTTTVIINYNGKIFTVPVTVVPAETPED